MAVEAKPSAIQLIAAVTPKSGSRAWQTAVHPRLPMLATCNADRTVNVYSLSNFVQLSSITGGHKRSIRTVAWKPNTAHESVLATGSFDASVGIWRRDDNWGKEGADGSDNVAGEGSLSSETDFTRASPAGGDDDDNDEREEEEEWRFALVLDGHDSEVKSVSWSAGGNLLATCARDKSVWIWEEVGDDDYETIAVLQEHAGDVKTVAWHPEEELLASGSYDDDIRLWREDVDDWDCVAVLRGHEATVWMVAWEGLRLRGPRHDGSSGTHVGVNHQNKQQQAWIDRRDAAGPRLASCSDDGTIRVWRRVPKDKSLQQQRQNTMSIIRTGSIEETWIQEAQLPAAHQLSIYAVAWSSATGRIVSTGADGKIIVYEERWSGATDADKDSAAATERNTVEDTAIADTSMNVDGAEGKTQKQVTQIGTENENKDKDKDQGELDALTSWHVVAELETAHGVYEINHVAWSRRADNKRITHHHDKGEDGRITEEDEETIISTGDDGEVRIWSVAL